MFTIKYRKLNTDHSIVDFEKFIYDAIKRSTKNEGFNILENSDDFFRIYYYKKLPSADFLYNNRTEKMIIENTQKLYESELYFSKIKYDIRITGTRNSSRLLEEYIDTYSNLSITNNPISLESIYRKFNQYNYSIKKLSYKNVNFIQTKLPSLTLEFSTNQDALNMIKKLKSSPSELQLCIDFKEDEVAFINFNLKKGDATIDMDKYREIDYENVKESLNNLKE